MKRTYADSHPPLLNPRDVDFLLYEWLDVAELCDRPRYSEHSKESFDSVLDLTADIATKRFAPHYKTADANEPFVNPDGDAIIIRNIQREHELAGLGGRDPGMVGDAAHTAALGAES